MCFGNHFHLGMEFINELVLYLRGRNLRKVSNNCKQILGSKGVHNNKFLPAIRSQRVRIKSFLCSITILNNKN